MTTNGIDSGRHTEGRQTKVFEAADVSNCRRLRWKR